MCVDGTIDPLSILVLSGLCFLVKEEYLPDYRVNHYRNVLRQLCKRIQKMVTQHSKYFCAMQYEPTLRHSIYPPLRYNCNLFREFNPWLLHKNCNLLSHQATLFSRTQYYGTDAICPQAPIRVNIYDWQGKPIHNCFSTVKRSLIQKYAIYTKHQRLHDICKAMHLDPQLTSNAFGKATNNALYTSVVSARWRFSRQSGHFGYCYNIFAFGHKNNPTKPLLLMEPTHHQLLAELLRQVKRCDFPTCTHCYAQPKHKTWRLCQHHAEQWKSAFQRVVRPSTFELLQHESPTLLDLGHQIQQC